MMVSIDSPLEAIVKATWVSILSLPMKFKSFSVFSETEWEKKIFICGNSEQTKSGWWRPDSIDSMFALKIIQNRMIRPHFTRIFSLN